MSAHRSGRQPSGRAARVAARALTFVIVAVIAYVLCEFAKFIVSFIN